MFCRNCGREGKTGEVYCGGCGVRLFWEEAAGQADAKVAKEAVDPVDAEAVEEAVNQADAEAVEETTKRADAEAMEEAAANQADTATVKEAVKQADAMATEEAVKQADSRTEKEAAESAEIESGAFVINKNTIKKALLGVAGFAAAIILLVCCLSGAEIRDVKNSVLDDYNYGVTIGDALHKWFDGTEKWSSFSEDGVVYVMARGMTKYTPGQKKQEQIFLFHHVNDTYFVFDGAFDSNGDYLYTENATLNLLDFGDLIVWGLYTQTLKAAFGDEEALQQFIGTE